MKKIIFILVLCTGFLSQTFAQFRKIPAEVTEAFATKFPNAKNVEWADKVTGFEATFNLSDHRQQATFSSKGDWKRSEVSISEEELPAAVKDGLQKSKYSDWEDRSYVYQTEDGSELYRIYVKKNDFQKKFLYFNKDGRLLKDAITL